MQTGLLHLHNILRWVLLILLILSIVKAYTGWQNKRTFTQGDRRIWLFTLISAHINFLIGIYLLLWGRYGMLRTDLQDTTSVMKDRFLRFFWVEHPTFMILSIVMITLGNSMGKKAVPDEVKYKRAFWFFFIALLMILVAVPWPFRTGIGRPWFPGM